MEFSSVLRSRRLTLRCLAVEDAPALLTIFADAADTAPMGWPTGVSPTDAVFHIRQALVDSFGLSWTALLRETGETAGMVCLRHIDRVVGTAELSYGILPTLRGMGLAAEAARLITGYGLTMLGLRRITARPSSDNPASVQLLKQLGFQQTGQTSSTEASVSRLLFERSCAPD